MDDTETLLVDKTTVACDGGDGPLGHPNVYLKIGDEREIVCPYCSKKFIFAEGAGSGTGH